MKVLRALLVLGAVLLAVGGLIRLLNPLPSLEDRVHSTALTDTADTALGQAVGPAIAAHPGLSGVHPLTDALSAFAARVHLARAAQRSLDVQYYIWHGDLSGTLLFDEVRAAADRGVRVRMLLDDNSTSGLDPTLASLDTHPNIQLRLFNPFVIRSPRFVGYLTDFPRLNRRMHNKSFTADNQATIVGGRNVGDEYFGAGDGALFADLDLVAVGPVVADVSASFDRYWASASAYPADRILPGSIRRGERVNSAEGSRAAPDLQASSYLQAARSSDYIQALLDQRLRFEWAPTRMASDDPAKGLGQAAPEAMLWPKLTALLGTPQRKLDLVSGYFVPTETGVETFERLARQGVKVTILTNALEATDVPIVHAGYAKWRPRLLKAGVRLFEMRNPVPGDGIKRDVTALGSTGSGARGAGSALHAKTFSVDGVRVFVGSFNFDPRSANLNTELGFVVESLALAARMDAALTEFIPRMTYEVKLSDAGTLIWLENAGGKMVRHDSEPGTSWRQRAAVAVLSMLPIEWLL